VDLQDRIPAEELTRESASFRGAPWREPQVRNCAPGNLQIPDSMLRIAPE
jgi:hypothetical protein